MLYQRALHPELFNIQGRQSIIQDEYELENWILPGGHIMRFQVNGRCISEAVIDQDSQLPQRGLVQTLPCLGEKELDETIENTIHYVTSVQTEQISDNLFLASYNEMKEFALETEALTYEWKSEDGGANLSILDTQKYKREIHTQSYHLIGSPGYILRTQSIFEIA